MTFELLLNIQRYSSQASLMPNKTSLLGRVQPKVTKGTA